MRASAVSPRGWIVTWPSFDGVEIEGLLWLPASYKQGDKLPLILSIHGGPAGVEDSRRAGRLVARAGREPTLHVDDQVERADRIEQPLDGAVRHQHHALVHPPLDEVVVVLPVGVVVDHRGEVAQGGHGHERVRPRVHLGGTPGRAQFPRGTPEHVRYLHWMHFAEGTAQPPLLLKLLFDRLDKGPMPFFVRPVARAIAQRAKSSFVQPNIDQATKHEEGYGPQLQRFRESATNTTGEPRLLLWPEDGVPSSPGAGLARVGARPHPNRRSQHAHRNP